jgi:hypothetical protein
MVAIGGTLYCHDKYLVATSDLSIATLNIVVAIGETIYCRDKCLVARGGQMTWILISRNPTPCTILVVHGSIAITYRTHFSIIS